MAGRSLERLDKILVRRGLASSRGEAGELIRGGCVAVAGMTRDKPSSMTDSEASIEVAGAGEKRWVGRGARKLVKALGFWGVDPKGWDCADIGASTGGFTHALLEYGAARVAAIDVGYGQLAWKLRNDPRVKVMERTNARYVTPGDIGWVSSLVTVDASFISLRSLLPNLRRLMSDSGSIIALVKPQFEVGRGRVGRGVVRDPSLHLEALAGVAEFANASCGLAVRGATYSPILGGEGNIEFIFLLAPEGRGADSQGDLDFADLVGEAHSRLR